MQLNDFISKWLTEDDEPRPRIVEARGHARGSSTAQARGVAVRREILAKDTMTLSDEARASLG
jgi:hypothetical protein